MIRHPLIPSKTLLYSHRCHFYSKQEVTGHSLLCLHLVVEVHASSSAVILQSVWKIHDPTTSVTWQYLHRPLLFLCTISSSVLLCQLARLTLQFVCASKCQRLPPPILWIYQHVMVRFSLLWEIVWYRLVVGNHLLRCTLQHANWVKTIGCTTAETWNLACYFDVSRTVNRDIVL